MSRTGPNDRMSICGVKPHVHKVVSELNTARNHTGLVVVTMMVMMLVVISMELICQFVLSSLSYSIAIVVAMVHLIQPRRECMHLCLSFSSVSLGLTGTETDVCMYRCFNQMDMLTRYPLTVTFVFYGPDWNQFTRANNPKHKRWSTYIRMVATSYGRRQHQVTDTFRIFEHVASCHVPARAIANITWTSKHKRHRQYHVDIQA